jgi:ATP-dependent Clp protease adaptor protein ClpS
MRLMAGDPKDGKGTPPSTPKGPDERREREADTLVMERNKRPRRHKVLMHNDDYTPMEFVVHVLENVFHRSKAEATRIMLSVHTDGAAIAGVYSREIAETRTAKTIQYARSEGYPLLVTTEPE